MVRHKIRLFLFMAVMLVVGILPATVFAAGDVTYLDEAGVTQTLSAGSYTVVTDTTTAWQDGWYVAEGDVPIANRVTVTGDVKLILTDGSHLTINGGINVADGNSFTVYAQSTAEDTMGKLTATSESLAAGIGGGIGNDGGTITITGGTVTASGGNNTAGIGGGERGDGGEITISGGTVTATSGEYGGGAGIGGGMNGSGGTITISGGTVEANGGYNGAGIGGGERGDGGEITISGGTVEANGGESAAGIGGGERGAGGMISISGGTVTANGGDMGGAGIGGGIEGSGGEINITDGSVTANGGDMGGAGIGGGWSGSGGEINITDGSVTANGGDMGGAGIGDGDSGSGGTFTTGTNGTAIIFASSISDQADKANWSGLIFEGTDGKVHGASYTLTEALTIPAGNMLTIESGKTLIVESAATLTNNGTITNSGAVKVNVGAGYSGTQPVGNPVQYQVLAPAGVGCTINYGDGEYVSHGTAITFTVTAQDGYDPAKMTVSANGQALTAVNGVYTLEVTVPVEISAAAVKETTPPVISGITNGATYYTTQIATVSDESTVSVTLNGTAVNGTTVSLPGNTNATYVLVATDAAGNRTTCTVTMKPIASLTESVDDITSENVTPEDKDALEKAKADLEAVNTDHATDAEKAELQNKIEQINQALESLLNKPVDYKITAGNGGKWTVGDTTALTMTADGPVEKFTGIEVDGKAVDAVNYTVTSGSTILSLKPEYLNTLSVGKHTLTVIYTDGKVSGEFEIVAAQTTTPPAAGGGSSTVTTVTNTGTSIPQTGDDSNLAVWMILMAAAACGIAGMTISGAKKKCGK